MKNSYLTAGIKPGKLLELLLRNKISWNPNNIFRILFLLQSTIWPFFFALYEQIKFKKKLVAHPPVTDPIFIIGHWRTGTTFLHKLMSFDPNLYTPTLFDVAIPDSCLTSYQYFKPLMKLMVTKHRPMDNVIMGINEPQEDEYALFRLSGYSPLEKLIFPETKEYFLLNCTSFLPDKLYIENWRNNFLLFYKKLHYKSGKTIVSKNPFNSMRIKELMTLFPDARFIHITRHPFDVVPSTIHMFEIVQKQNILNSNFKRPTVNEITMVLKRILKTIFNDIQTIPNEKFYQIKFEDLERDPLTSLKKVYQSLNLSFSELLAQKIKSFLSENQDYKKNTYTLSLEEKEIISQSLKEQMDYLGY